MPEGFASWRSARQFTAVVLSLLLSACGGGDRAPSTSATGSSALGIVFTQGRSAVPYSNIDGIQTVTLHNAPFEISVPDTGFTGIFIHTTPSNTGDAYPFGNVMARYFDENTSGWFLAAVDPGDISINGFSYEDTVMSGSLRILKIKEIRDRYQTTKTIYGTLYLQFYVATGPTPAGMTDTIRVVLN